MSTSRKTAPKKKQMWAGMDKILTLFFFTNMVQYEFFFKFMCFIYLFLAAWDLCCCTRAFSSSSVQGLLFVAVHRLLIMVACCRACALGAWASVVVARGLSSCGSRALECRLGSCGIRA